MTVKVDTIFITLLNFQEKLVQELGYCSGQEIRDNEQWVYLSGSWEKWNDAIAGGYSVDYLEKILKRNEGR